MHCIQTLIQALSTRINIQNTSKNYHHRFDIQYNSLKRFFQQYTTLHIIWGTSSISVSYFLSCFPRGPMGCSGGFILIENLPNSSGRTSYHMGQWTKTSYHVVSIFMICSGRSTQSPRHCCHCLRPLNLYKTTLKLIKPMQNTSK